MTKQTQVTKIEQQFLTYITTAEQVIAQDGKPAVLVTTSEEYRHPGAAPSVRGTGRTLMRFPSETPEKVLGLAMVGQWSEKVLSRHAQGAFAPNTDPATYQDYAAWYTAFREVYSNS